MRKITTLLTILFCFLAADALATHNASGEILYKKIGDFTYEFTLVTITEYCQKNADRPEATIEFSDGTSQTSARANGNGEPLTNCFKKNIYKFIHTFPGYDTYTVSYRDPFRNFDVVNMSNSGATEFYVESKIVINPFLSENNSPTLLLDPLDVGALGQLFLHNPNAFDEDGDSLSFKLVTPKQNVNQDVFNYSLPAASSSFSINQKNGEVFWDAPVQTGLYNIAILIEEWRVANNGTSQLIGCVVRDMQIIITETQNRKPEITHRNDTCILAGTFLKIPFTVIDTDAGDIVTFSASGGPFEVSPAATFNPPVSSLDTITDTLRWQTTCELARKEPYQVVFKARDNGGTPGAYPNNIKLVDLFTWQVTVVPDGPKNLTAAALGNGIDLLWDKSNCPKIVGYNIYRRQGSFPFDESGCNVGVPAFTGYTLVGRVDGIDNTSFFDNNNGTGLIRGVTYCYRVVARLADYGESYASNEACDALVKDVPVLTNVDVLDTKIATGKIYVEWSKPSDLDTTQALPPYRYALMRANSSDPSSFSQVFTSSSASFSGFNDTSYQDSSLNTLKLQYIYRVDLYASDGSNEIFFGSSQLASSVFLSIVALDNELELNFSYNVPWKIDTFVVYRQNGAGFDSIGISTSNKFIDKPLTNGVDYCYYAKSIGGYNSVGLKDPLINNSQVACSQPKDTVPPCPPILSVIPDCDGITNFLEWQNPNIICDSTDDVVTYRIYYSDKKGDEFILLKGIHKADSLSFEHVRSTSIAGCYFMVAIDSFGNISEASNEVCVDNCPEYELPNVFSPNADGKNDLFTPFVDQNKFIEDIEIEIYTRWGSLVYKTKDKNINWDGTHYITGADVAPGVYFYVCTVNEVRLDGIFTRTVKGFVQLYR